MRCRMACCRAEEPRRFAVTAGLTGQIGEASRMSGTQRCASISAARVSASWASRLGLFRLTLRDRNAGARRQRERQVAALSLPTRHRRPSREPRRDPRLPARPRHSSSATLPRHLTYDTQVLPGGLTRLLRRREHPRQPGPQEPTPS